MTEMVETLINGRWTLKLPDHRAARPEWDLAHGGWERERLDHMHSTTKPWDNVLYIGSEEGEFPALLTQWGACVYMVEPNELVWPNIRAIWEANNLASPIALYSGFCGRESSNNWPDGVSGPWPEAAYGPLIGDHGFKELCDPGDRPIVTVDDIAHTFVPNMISMDVEGSEWDVLRGAEQTLREHKPRIYLSLHPEFVWRLYDVYAAEVRQWIKDLGYREELLAYSHEVHLYYEPV